MSHLAVLLMAMILKPIGLKSRVFTILVESGDRVKSVISKGRVISSWDFMVSTSGSSGMGYLTF